MQQCSTLKPPRTHPPLPPWQTGSEQGRRHGSLHVPDRAQRLTRNLSRINRLEMAHWISSAPPIPSPHASSPTASSQSSSAEGIVETLGDFGSTGLAPPRINRCSTTSPSPSRPTHKWSLKALTEGTQPSAPPTARTTARQLNVSQQQTPATDLLARGPRTRLSAQK